MHKVLQQLKLIDKMSLRAGALKVEGPVYNAKEEQCLGKKP